jgi:NTE family protein
MSSGIFKVLVLQGGGAVGAYELGAARVIYGERPDYAPDLIAGVSIGAITATLLARPKNRRPLETLEAFWKEVEVTSWIPGLERYVALFGNPKFFRQRLNVFNLLSSTSVYDLSPLRDTLQKFVDEEELKKTDASPRLLITAVNVTTGRKQPFDSGKMPFTLDHVLASSSVPGAFPPLHIGKEDYWDGGVFDNTPLGAVYDLMSEPTKGEPQEILVVNLFANAGQLPRNFVEVGRRALNILLSNKTASDLSLTKKFNSIAVLLDKIRNNPQWNALKESAEFKNADQQYKRVPEPITIEHAEEVTEIDPADFSHEGIQARAKAGEAAARKALRLP